MTVQQMYSGPWANFTYKTGYTLASRRPSQALRGLFAAACQGNCVVEMHQLGFEGVLKKHPNLHCDNGGRFCETYSEALWQDTGFCFDFVQGKLFSPKKVVLRGRHYQLPLAAQDKLLRVYRGSNLNVAVDIFRKLTSFGHWVSREISADAWNQVLVPMDYSQIMMSDKNRGAFSGECADILDTMEGY